MDKFLRRSTSSETDKPKSKKAKFRKYDESYIELGFMENSDGRPRCVVCLQVLANEAMKPAKLKRHLTTKHAQHANKPKEYFQRARDDRRLG